MNNINLKIDFNERSQIFEEQSYVPWQPGFKIFASDYYGKILTKKSLLKNIVADFYEINGGNFKNDCVLTIPDGCTDIMFAFDGSNIKTYISTGVKTIKKFYFGNQKYLFGIRFMPGATYNVFHDSIKEFVHNPVPAEFIIKNDKFISEKISNAANFKERVNISIKYVEENLLKNDTKENLIKYCVSSICKHRGNLSIQNLSNDTGYTSRYICDLFQNYVGLSPKNLCEVIRLQFTMFAIQKYSNLTLSQIATIANYSDQSHMNREFKKYIHKNALSTRNLNNLLQIKNAEKIIF